MVLLDEGRGRTGVADVVTVRASDWPEAFAEVSVDETVYVYAVDGERPLSVYDVPAVAPMRAPLRKTEYPAIPTLSTDADHISVMLVEVMLDARSPCGTDGATLSAMVAGVVTVIALDVGDTLPAAS